MKQFVLYFTLVAAMSAWATPTLCAPNPDDAEEARFKREAVAAWKKIFGDETDFAKEDLFACMTYVHPQPASDLEE